MQVPYAQVDYCMNMNEENNGRMQTEKGVARVLEVHS
jgi:hypothetical protein